MGKTSWHQENIRAVCADLLLPFRVPTPTLLLCTFSRKIESWAFLFKLVVVSPCSICLLGFRITGLPIPRANCPCPFHQYIDTTSYSLRVPTLPKIYIYTQLPTQKMNPKRVSETRLLFQNATDCYWRWKTKINKNKEKSPRFKKN